MNAIYTSKWVCFFWLNINNQLVSSGIVNKSHRKFDLNPIPNSFPCCDVTPLHQSSVVIRHCTAIMPTIRTHGLGQEARDTIWIVIKGPSPRAPSGTWHFDVTSFTFWNFQRCPQRWRKFLDKQEIAAENFKSPSCLFVEVRAIRYLKRWRNLRYQDNNEQKVLK